MDREDELKIRVELNEVIGQWWDDTTVDMPLIANDVIPLMAEAALSVLLAANDTQEYLRGEGLLKEGG